MSALSDLINERLDRHGLADRSLRELSDLSDNKLSKDAVRLYRGGLHGRPSEEVLQAWSVITRTSVAELRAAAGVPAGEDLPYTPPAEAARLSQRQRLAIDELIRAVVGADRQEEPHATEVQEPEQGQRSSPRRSAGRTGAPIAPPAREAARSRQKSAVERAETAGHPNAEELAELAQLGRKAHSTSQQAGDGTERDR